MRRKPYPLEIPPVGYRAPMKGDKREIHKPNVSPLLREPDGPQEAKLSPSGTTRGYSGKGSQKAREDALEGIRNMLDE